MIDSAVFDRHSLVIVIAGPDGVRIRIGSLPHILVRQVGVR
jgi:hypothetical protein